MILKININGVISLKIPLGFLKFIPQSKRFTHFFFHTIWKYIYLQNEIKRKLFERKMSIKSDDLDMLDAHSFKCLLESYYYKCLIMEYI